MCLLMLNVQTENMNTVDLVVGLIDAQIAHTYYVN